MDRAKWRKLSNRYSYHSSRTNPATVTIPINDDGQKETSEYFLTAFFADSLSDGTYVSKASRHPQVEIENSTTFQDVLNIDLDTSGE